MDRKQENMNTMISQYTDKDFIQTSYCTYSWNVYQVTAYFILEKNALSIIYSFLFTSFLQNDEDMLIPPGLNTKTKDDILPSPEILELIDMHVSEVNICDFKDKSYRISLQPPTIYFALSLYK